MKIVLVLLLQLVIQFYFLVLLLILDLVDWKFMIVLHLIYLRVFHLLELLLYFLMASDYHQKVWSLADQSQVHHHLPD